MADKTQKDKIDEMYDFWHKPDIIGSPTRAKRVDDLLKSFDQGRFLIRTTYWLMGAVVIVAINFEKVREFFWRW